MAQKIIYIAIVIKVIIIIQWGYKILQRCYFNYGILNGNLKTKLKGWNRNAS